MFKFFICQLGVKVREIGKIKFGFDNRMELEDGQEFCVICNSI